MSFTIANAVAQAESHVDDDIDDADAIEWTNEFLRDKMPEDFWTKTSTSIAATEDEWENLPTGFVMVEEMKDSNDDDYATENWQIVGSQIRFADTDTYTMYYRSIPTALTAVSSTVPVNDLFKSALAFYLAARWWFKEDSMEPDSQHWMQECDKAISKVLSNMQARSFVRPRLRW